MRKSYGSPEYEATRKAFYAKHYPMGGVGIEIGVHRGDNFKNLIEATKPRQIHAVDPWAPSKHFRRPRERDEVAFRQMVERMGSPPWIHVHKCTSEKAAQKLATQKFDWVYIDGDHDHEDTLNDLRLWAPKCHGIVGVHDYESRFAGVVSACREYFGREPDHLCTETTDAIFIMETA